mgnify:FL=1
MKITKKITASLMAVCLSASCMADGLSIIPRPAKLVEGNGQFTFGQVTTAWADAYEGDSIHSLLKSFEQEFTSTTGLAFKASKAAKAALQLRLNPSLKGESYCLSVSKTNVIIEAARPVGFFYALQTLKQMLPTRAVMAGVSVEKGTSMTLPVVEIEDAPRFGWRGFMLDEGRHFFGKKAVKQVLDVMAAYKMNRFHWHLTDDQGWRVEIKKYPRLTTYGAWRNTMTLSWGNTLPDGERYGGYYTQDDVREIVAYARERFIEIVPEVDIPGHSQAAVAVYPEFLACDPEKPHEVWLSQGVSTDVINVANPKAVQFAKDVIDELITLFPYQYMHLGGDECPVKKWEQNKDCQALLKQIGSKNYRDLQIHFYKQLKDYVASKPAQQQRHFIFWNEVLHGNTSVLGKDFTVMAWVGADKAAQEAAKRGLTTILSPQIPYYINRRQSKDVWEPRSQGWGTETVEAVYNYVPMKNVAENLQEKYMGVQANFWTEWVENTPKLQYLLLPRLAAVAEAGWTPQAERSYPDFLKRLQQEPSYYDMKGMNYGKHVFK